MCTVYCTLLTELVSINWLPSATTLKKNRQEANFSVETWSPKTKGDVTVAKSNFIHFLYFISAGWFNMESTDGHTFKASMVNSESAGKVLYVCHAWLGNALGYPRMNWKVLLGRRTSGTPWLVHLSRDLSFGNWKTTNRWMMTVYCINHYLCCHFLQRSKRSLDGNICNVLQNTKLVVRTLLGVPGPVWKLLNEICYFTMQKISTVYAQILQQKTKQKVAKITLQISKLLF